MNGSNSHLPPDNDLEPEAQHRPSLHIRLERHFWGRVLSGFLVLLPLIITAWILVFAFHQIDGLFGRLSQALIRTTPFHDGFPTTAAFIAGIISVLFGLAVLYFFGTLMTLRIGRMAVDVKVAVLSHIPVVKNIYGVAKQATDSLTTPSGQEVNRVVLVEWPRPGLFALGFTTGHSHPSHPDDAILVVVYIPTVPNPTSGNLAFVREEEVYATDMSMEEAMKIVFSGGVVLPENLKMHATTRFRRVAPPN
ncbi:MAG: DUF502 domain-containing protein [Chloroflexi bacterium]|nr:DUF502 domain-containing protein [Chloroflexota bacterium]